MQRLNHPPLALLFPLLVAAGLKAWLVISAAVPFHADEAVVALMARHILLGERPVFFYGQAYMGSLDAWLVAGGFALFGEQVWAIRLVQGCLYLLTLATTAWLGKALFSSWKPGIVAAWLLALPAVNLSLYTTATLGGYGEMLLIGNLILLASLRIGKQLDEAGRAPVWLWLSWGFLAGLGLWAFGLTLVYSLPAGIFLSWKLFSTLSSRPVLRSGRKPALSCLGFPILLVVCGALLGSAPWWVYALRHGARQLIVELSGGNIAGVEGLSGLELVARHLASLVLLGGTAVFGLRPPWEVRWLVLPLLPFVLLFWLGVLVHAAGRLYRERPGRESLLLLAGVPLTLAAGFLFTPFGADPSGRYFLPLAVPLALFAAGLILRLWEKAGARAWGLLALVLIYNIIGTVDCVLRTPPGLTTQFNPVTQTDTRFMDELADFLRRHGETRGYTNYWVAYPLAFLSGEELVFVPRLPYHLDFRYTERDDRYAPYGVLVEQAERPAYITTRHPDLNARLRSQFTKAGLSWQEAEIGDYYIFYEFSEPAYGMRD